MDDVALAVAEYLELDMPRMLDVPFEDHARVAEGIRRFALGRGERLGEAGRVAHDTHALAAAARGGLDHASGNPVLAASAARMRRLLVFPVVARHQRHGVFFHQRLRGGLEPIASMLSGRGPMKTMPAVAQALAKSVFSERKP